MDKESLKEKLAAKKKEMAAKKAQMKEKQKEELELEAKGTEPLVTCRVLFVSALDKIYIIVLLILFAAATFINFRGDITSLEYNFFLKVGKEIIVIIGMYIIYLFTNYLYKCVSKTMLCLTKNEVYKEKYMPFKRKEVSIPLSKITAVSTQRVFYIFRSVAIHQYGKLPMIFFTWNNKEFKDKLTELLTDEKDKIKNKHENKNILSKDSLLLKIVCAILVLVIVVLAVVRFFGYMFNSQRKMAGTYRYNDKKIVLKKDASCDVSSIVDKDITACRWTVDEDGKEISVLYEYNYVSTYYGNLNYTGSLFAKYDKDKKAITYEGKEFKK